VIVDSQEPLLIRNLFFDLQSTRFVALNAVIRGMIHISNALERAASLSTHYFHLEYNPQALESRR